MSAAATSSAARGTADSVQPAASIFEVVCAPLEAGRLASTAGGTAADLTLAYASHRADPRTTEQQQTAPSSTDQVKQSRHADRRAARQHQVAPSSTEALAVVSLIGVAAGCLRATRLGTRIRKWGKVGGVQALMLMLLFLAQPASADTGAMHDWETSVSPFLLPAGVVCRSTWRALEEEFDTSRLVDWKDIIAEIQESSDMPQCEEFIGDDVTEKGACTGCRLVTLNANKSLMSSDSTTGQSFAHELGRVMAVRRVDLAVIQEPGITSWGRAEGVLKARMAGDWRYRYVPRVTQPGQQTVHGGMLLIMRPEWEAALATCKVSKQDCIERLCDKGETDRLVAVEFCNPLISQPTKKRRHNERMLLMAVHSYNTGGESNKPWGANTAAQQSIIKAMKDRAQLYRGKYPKASVVVAGDMNFARITALDTAESGQQHRVGLRDAHADQTVRAVGHQMAADLESAGMVDVFRQLHPWTVAVSRHPIGEQTGISRRLDQVWLTAELADSPATRCGIDRYEGSLHTDHRMVTCDLPIDVANSAGVHLRVWDPVVQRKLKIVEGVQSECSDGRKAYRERMREWCMKLATALTHDQTLDSRVDALHAAMQRAATGTVMQVKRSTSPKWVTQVKDMTTADWKLSRRRAHLRNLVQKVRQGDSEDDLQDAADSVPEAPSVSDEAAKKIGVMVTATGLKHMLLGDTEEALSAMREECTALDSYLSAQSRNERARAARDSVKRRRALFDEGKVRATVQSVYKAMSPVREMTRLIAEDGRVLAAADVIAGHVESFVTGWFSSKVHVSSRFGSLDAVCRWDKTHMSGRAREAVDLFYEGGDMSASHYRDHPEYWEGWDKQFSAEELDTALRQFTAAKAPGPSQLQAEMFKWLPKEAKQVSLDLLNDCKNAGQFPSHANAGLMWLLPKGEAGKTDLNKTRPIALMETLAKIYERLWYNRIIKVVTERDMLDPAQYGGVPGGGTTDPMQVLASVLDDARLSKSQLHCLSLDLSKAFDTVEYWSQAASWSALGMPEELIRLLIQMDSSASTQVALGGGRYTNPVLHGRGVRQGSILGPLKWVAFMHWWIHGVKHSMRGKGYRMQSAVEGEVVEVQAQMLIDDSNWFTHSAECMQECVKLLEEWVWLHGLIVNRSKTELMTVGAQSNSPPILWNTGEQLVPVAADKACRYLGAWYESGGRWQEQQRVLTSRLEELLQPMITAARTLSMAEAKYLINSKIMPAMLYPTQVAILPQSFLRKVDDRVRAVFSGVAGVSGNDVPTEYYYVDQEAGGYGIDSYEKRYHSMAVTNWLQLLNRNGGDMAGKVAAAAVAQHKRAHAVNRNPFTQPILAPHAPTTQVGKFLCSLQALELCVHSSDSQLCNASHAFAVAQSLPQYVPAHVSLAIDVEAADSNKRQGMVEVYTDGSTEGAGGDGAEAGWGCVAYGRQAEPMQELWRASGRVEGLQDNFGAESEALLQALLRVHTGDDVVIGCDNASCVSLCSQEEALRVRSVADLLSMPARCKWGRVWSLIRHRAARGAATEVLWVHSHVDCEDRRVVKSGELTCMCHTLDPVNAEGECDPQHRAHRGNMAADEAAEQGREQSQLVDAEDSLSQGELKCALVDPARGRIDMPVKSLVRQKVQQQLLTAAGERSRRAKDLEEARSAADTQGWKRAALKVRSGSDISSRFLVRLWCDCLPTYSLLAKRIGQHVGGKTAQMYTPEGAQEPVIDSVGTCPLCEQEGETVEHVMCRCSCPGVAHHRAAAEVAVHRELERVGVDRSSLEWSTPGAKWQWCGFVTAEGAQALRCRLGRMEADRLLRRVQDIRMEAAVDMWKARNSAVLQWEQQRGVTKSKTEVKRGKWERAEPTGRKRGRPPKAESDLSEGALQAKLRKQEREDVATAKLQPGQTRAQVKAKLKRCRLNEKNLKKAAGKFDTMEVAVWQERQYEVIHTMHARPRLQTVRRSAPALRAQQLGVGSAVSVYWRPAAGGRRGKFWSGKVTALVPVQQGIVEQVVEYEGERRRYRHDLGAGKTKFRVDLSAAKVDDDSCQQGNARCCCSAHTHTRSHPWYDGDTMDRAECQCYFCSTGTVVDTGIPAMDHEDQDQADGTCSDCTESCSDAECPTGTVPASEAARLPAIECTDPSAPQHRQRRQASLKAAARLQLASMVKADTGATVSVAAWSVTGNTGGQDVSGNTEIPQPILHSGSLAALDSRVHVQRSGTFGTNGARASGSHLEGCNAEDTSGDSGGKAGRGAGEGTVRPPAQQLHEEPSKKAHRSRSGHSRGAEAPVSAGSAGPRGAKRGAPSVGGVGEEAEGSRCGAAGRAKDARLVGRGAGRRQEGGCEQVEVDVQEATLGCRRTAGRAHDRHQRSTDGATDGRQIVEAAARRGEQGVGAVLRRAERDRSGKRTWTGDSQRGHREPLQAIGHGGEVGGEGDGSYSGARGGDDRVGGKRARLRPRPGTSGVHKPAMPRLVSDGTHQQEEGRALPREDRATAQGQGDQDQGQQSRGETGGSGEAAGSGAEHVEVGVQVVVEVGDPWYTEVLLCREWEVGTAAEPGVHASAERASDRPLLQVQSMAALARSVPSTEGDRDMDEPPRLGQEGVPEDRMARGPPSEDRSEEGQQGQTGGTGPVLSEEMDASGAAAGAVASSSVNMAAGRKRLKGRQKLEAFAYTKKRLRAQHKKMNRRWQLRSDPYNFTDEELEVIMLYYPDDPRLQKTGVAEGDVSAFTKLFAKQV